MSTHPNQPRRPKGVPTGGQWQATPRPEGNVRLSGQLGDERCHTDGSATLGNKPNINPDKDLESIPRGPANPKPVVDRDGRCLVTDTTSEELVSPVPGFTRTAFHIGGQPHRKAAAGLAAKLYEARRDGQGPEGDLDGYLLGKKATVLLQTKTGSVVAQEGTVAVANGAVALLNKGSRTKGSYLFGRDTAPHVLDARPGYGHAGELAEAFRSVEASVPELEPARFDDIPVHDGEGEPPKDVVAAFVFDHPGFDGDQDGRGCVFFATDRDPEEVVNGYFVAPPGSGLESEHGSFTTEQLSRWGGRVKGFRPGSLSFRDAMELGEKASRWSDYADMSPAWEAVGVHVGPSARS